MLPRSARLHDSADFRRVTRSGVRSGRPTLVVHVASGAGSQTRVGLVVSKAVGGAVVRNRVKRRLRQLAVRELGSTSGARDVVVRALPAAAASPSRLEADLTSAWAQAMKRLLPGSTRVLP